MAIFVKQNKEVYGCEIWGDFSEKSDLKVVEMNFLNYVLHLPLNASKIAVRGEVG